MEQQTRNITDRLTEIEQEIRELRRESTMLSKIKRTTRGIEHLLQSGDTFSARKVVKFDLLARVAGCISEHDNYAYGGATTKEPYKSVLAGVERGRTKIVPIVDGRESTTIQTPPEEQTPLMEEVEPLNYNTFRSHLTRFRDEGRIFYNISSRRWRITALEVSAEGFSQFSDDDRDRHAD